MEQRDKEKVKNAVSNAKDNFTARMNLLNLILKERNLPKYSSDETSPEIMLDLMTDILYHKQYLDAFKSAIDGTDESGNYYNIPYVNRHLKTILNEYEMITNNLDSIIFKDNDLCK